MAQSLCDTCAGDTRTDDQDIFRFLHIFPNLSRS
jgi:hypothetical protein